MEYSIKIKTIAKQILLDKKIVETLQKYGNPLIIGSYELDLMYGNDIDIVVKSENPREDSMNALNEFMQLRGFQKFEYGDFVEHKRKNRPEGYIVNLLGEYDGQKWEVEIWFFEDISNYEKQLEELKAKIDEDSRIEILERKYLRAENGESKFDISSMDIYRDVLGIDENFN